MTKTQLLFLVILVEGYVVLAVELLAIRTLIPFVGSGTEAISIIISSVLLPLAVGYHYGGNSYKASFAKSKIKNSKKLSIRKILLKNITSSLIVLTLGLSYIFQEMFFFILMHMGITHKLLQTALYCVLFLSFPVFLLGQTVPLISNYFSRKKLSEITGRMLFFSTTGSFLGSVFSTIVLMTYAGVHYTIMFTLSLLCLLTLLLMRRALSFESLFCVMILSVIYLLNNGNTMDKLNIVSDNAYNTVMVIEDKKNDTKILSINRSASSRLSSDPKKRFDYVNYMEDNFIQPGLKKGTEPMDILVIGAGGFTLGINDRQNNYTFVDIDPALKDVAEQYFLPEKISPNKKFIAASARAFLHGHDKKYSLIFIDVYNNSRSIPMECITREFLLDVKKLVKENGIVAVNVISSPTFSDKFTARYHNTFASVFPIFTRQIIQSDKDSKLGEEKGSASDKLKNVMYIYFNNEYVNDNTVYTDDKNSYSLDRID